MDYHWILFSLSFVVFVIFCISLIVILYFLWGSLKSSESRTTHILDEVTKGKKTEFPLGGISIEDEAIILSFLHRRKIPYHIEEELVNFSINEHNFIHQKRVLKLEQPVSQSGKVLNFPK